jgi:hypothetical protein
MSSFGRPPLPQYWANIATPGQIQTDAYILSNDAGVANAYVVTLNPPITSYVKGLRVRAAVSNTNTGASTLNVNGLGPVAIVRRDGTPTQINDLPSGSLAEFEHDGTHFQLLSTLNYYPVGVRQTVASGPLTAAGTANHITAGTGLAANLSTNGGANPVTVNYAAGSSLTGDVNYVNRVMADVANAWSGLPANNLSFISTDYSAGGPTYGSTLVPPQYGYAFNPIYTALLHFDISLTADDYGNAWTTVGTVAQSSTSKFGTRALGIAGGTGNYIKSTVFKPAKTWTLEGWFNTTTLTGVQTLFCTGTNQFGGLNIYLNNGSAGKLSYYLSSNGSAWDIASGISGTIAVTAGQWFHFALTFDGATYRAFINGALDWSVASSSAIYSSYNEFKIGAVYDGTNSFNGEIDEIRFSPCARYTAAFTAPASAFTADGDFFSVPQMQMQSITGPGPTFTPVNRVYHGEVTTNGAGVASVTPYAYNGRYNSGRFAVAASNTYYKNHNLGVDTFRVFAYGALKQGGPLNVFITAINTNNYGALASLMTRTSMALIVELEGACVALDGSYNANPAAVEAVMIAERPW